MSIFSKIKEAIFGHKAQAATPAPEAKPAIPMGQASSQPAPQPAASVPLSEIDVVANLTALAIGKDLDWKHSIVDLMKLVGIDSSFTNRKELAHELGDLDYSGTAEENMALHRAVMKALAEHGGKVPATMLD